MLLENLANIIAQKQKFETPNFPYQNFGRTRSFDTGEELPVTVKSSDWQTVEDIHGHNLIEKSFKFASFNHLMYFLNDVMRKSNEINHHPKVIIDVDIVTIELTTHEMGDVSDRDLDLAKYIDEERPYFEFVEKFDEMETEYFTEPDEEESTEEDEWL